MSTLPSSTDRSSPPTNHTADTTNDHQAGRTNENDRGAYPNAYENPYPAPKSVSAEVRKKREKNIIQLGEEMFKAFKAVNDEG